MMIQELKDRGRQLVDELSLQRDATMQQWMAHYIAELMHRAENADSDTERLRASDKCADIIVHLWERRAEDARRYVRSQVYSSFENLYQKREYADILRLALENPMDQVYPRDWDTRAMILWHLRDFERDLLFLLVSASAFDGIERGEAIDEAVKIFIEREDRLATIRHHLSDVFPGVEKLDLRNRRSVLRYVRSALRSIQDVRERLI